MLTVRYNQLGVRPGDRLLDFGCGGGRHSFEAMRRGAVITALDSDRETLVAAAPAAEVEQPVARTDPKLVVADRQHGC